MMASTPEQWKPLGLPATRPLCSVVATVACCLLLVGCSTLQTQDLGLETSELARNRLGQPVTGPLDDGVAVPTPDPQTPPAELAKVSLPEYRLEPPDILLINAVRMAPKSPYFIQTLDVLQVVVTGTLPDQPIAGPFQVEPDGMVNLGPAYGAVKLAGLSLIEATHAIERHLRRVLLAPEVSVSLLQMAGQQQISGEHLVTPDGTVNLGVFGSVYVAGMTLSEARETIEQHLGQFLESPQVSLNVFAYNSKVFYVITEGAGFGDTVVRIPITGNETVLDAIAQVGGMQRVSSKKMWISRPAPRGSGCDQILPIDWQAITKGANTATNYQLLPGDRLFIAENRLVALDSFISKLTAPFERVWGFTLLGSQTIQNLQRYPAGFQSTNF